MTVCLCRNRILRQPIIWHWLVVALISFCMLAHADAAETRSAVCRVYHQWNGQNNIGSGTLIDRTSDGRQGLVLTCAHLFTEGTGDIVVDFPGSKSHGAKLVGIDRQADLAALVIANPSATPVSVSIDAAQTVELYACGYGANGKYRCARGLVVGQASALGQTSLLIGDGVRSGDSGGGVFDNHGRLVAVVWGEAQGVTYASSGQPLRRFLARALGQPAANTISCPNGLCPLQRPSRPVVGPSGSARKPQVQPPHDPRWDQLQAAIQRLENTKQDKGNFLTRDELPDVSGFARREDVARVESESTSRHQSIIARLAAISSGRGSTVGKAAGAAAISLLGLSGPAGWAVLAGGTIGGWLIGQRMRRKNRGAGGRRREVFPG